MTGPWQGTYTGKKFHFMYPYPDEICLEDIAHALSQICRFGGHCSQFYSVAEHSIRVSAILPDALKLAGLMHDAGEAYITDIPRPIKRAYRLSLIEEPVIRAIAAKYGFVYPFPKEVREADNKLLATEARDLIRNSDEWVLDEEPLSHRIQPMCCYEAEIIFLDMAWALGIRE